jgi:uncharacterized protein YbbK (DUF523 family)
MRSALVGSARFRTKGSGVHAARGWSALACGAPPLAFLALLPRRLVAPGGSASRLRAQIRAGLKTNPGSPPRIKKTAVATMAISLPFFLRRLSGGAKRAWSRLGSWGGRLSAPTRPGGRRRRWLRGRRGGSRGSLHLSPLQAARPMIAPLGAGVRGPRSPLYGGLPMGAWAEPVLVSACLLGRTCRYDGRHNRDSALEGGELAPEGPPRPCLFCPEGSGAALGTPRPPACDSRAGAQRPCSGARRAVGTDAGADVTAGSSRVARAALLLCAARGIQLGLPQGSSLHARARARSTHPTAAWSPACVCDRGVGSREPRLRR